MPSVLLINYYKSPSTSETCENETLEIIQIRALFLILFQQSESTALAGEQLPEGP